MQADWLVQAPAFGLVLARCGGMLAIAPPLNVRQFPMTVRVGIAAALALALTPIATIGPGLEALAPLPYLALILREVAVGLLMGLAAALVFWGFTVGGQLIDTHLGAGDAGQRSGGRGPMTTLLYLTAGAAFLATDAHHWLLAALAEGLTTLPLGGSVALVAGAGGVATLAREMLLVGVAVAAPTLAVIYAAEVALAAFVRLLPHLGLAEPRGPVRWSAGLLGMAACLPLVGRLMIDHSGRVVEATRALVITLSGAG